VTKIAKQLSLFVLVMLITGSIDSIRNLPVVALFGSQLIFFYIFSAIVFLIPVALVSAELSSTHLEHGGIYKWVSLAFGESFGFFAIWLQWINTMIWFPTVLSFLAGTLAYLVDPALAHNKLYLILVICGTFWLVTLINLWGLKTSGWVATVATIVGMYIPMFLVFALAMLWIILGKPLQLHLTVHNLLPSFSHSKSWIALTAIITSYLGMELATVHVKSTNNSQKTFPIALSYSVVFIVVTMILGSLSIAFVLPKDQISLVDGIMQEFTVFFQMFHMDWMIPVIVVMILIGTAGGLINWIISPAKGLLQTVESGFLPQFFRKTNSHGVASRILIMQAVLVTLTCVVFLLMPSVNGSYWLLMDLSTQLYVLMYVIMFVAALVLRYKFADKPAYFKIPGGKMGVWLVCLLGLIGSGIALAVGFIPPTGINVGSAMHYEVLFLGGMLVLILPAILWILIKFVNRS